MMTFDTALHMADELGQELRRLGSHQDGPYIDSPHHAGMNRAFVYVYWNPSGFTHGIARVKICFTSDAQVRAYIAHGCKPDYALSTMPV